MTKLNLSAGLITSSVDGEQYRCIRLKNDPRVYVQEVQLDESDDLAGVMVVSWEPAPKAVMEVLDLQKLGCSPEDEFCFVQKIESANRLDPTGMAMTIGTLREVVQPTEQDDMWSIRATLGPKQEGKPTWYWLADSPVNSAVVQKGQIVRIWWIDLTSTDMEQPRALAVLLLDASSVHLLRNTSPGPEVHGLTGTIKQIVPPTDQNQLWEVEIEAVQNDSPGSTRFGLAFEPDVSAVQQHALVRLWWVEAAKNASMGLALRMDVVLDSPGDTILNALAEAYPDSSLVQDTVKTELELKQVEAEQQPTVQEPAQECPMRAAVQQAIEGKPETAVTFGKITEGGTVGHYRTLKLKGDSRLFVQRAEDEAPWSSGGAAVAVFYEAAPASVADELSRAHQECPTDDLAVVTRLERLGELDYQVTADIWSSVSQPWRRLTTGTVKAITPPSRPGNMWTIELDLLQRHLGGPSLYSLAFAPDTESLCRGVDVEARWVSSPVGGCSGIVLDLCPIPKGAITTPDIPLVVAPDCKTPDDTPDEPRYSFSAERPEQSSTVAHGRVVSFHKAYLPGQDASDDDTHHAYYLVGDDRKFFIPDHQASGVALPQEHDIVRVDKCRELNRQGDKVTKYLVEQYSITGRQEDTTSRGTAGIFDRWVDDEVYAGPFTGRVFSLRDVGATTEKHHYMINADGWTGRLPKPGNRIEVEWEALGRPLMGLYHGRGMARATVLVTRIHHYTTEGLGVETAVNKQQMNESVAVVKTIDQNSQGNWEPWAMQVKHRTGGPKHYSLAFAPDLEALKENQMVRIFWVAKDDAAAEKRGIALRIDILGSVQYSDQ